MSNKNLQEEIGKLKQELDSFDDTSPRYISPKVARLTQRVIATHTQMEEAVNLLMTLEITENIIGDLPENKLLMLNAEVLLLVEASRMTFKEKIEYLKRGDFIPRPIAEKALGINTLRRKFAHQNLENAKELRKYNSNDSIRNILKQLLDARKAVNRLFRNREKVGTSTK